MPEPKLELTKPISEPNFKPEFKARLRVITSIKAHLTRVLDIYERVSRPKIMRDKVRLVWRHFEVNW